MRWHHGWGALFFASVAGCTGNPEPATQVVVLVGGDPRIEDVRVAVLNENGRNVAEDRLIGLAQQDSGRRLPTSFTIVPDDFDDPDAHRFRLAVTGRWTQSGEKVPLVRRIVVGGFSPGKTTLLPLVLSGECADQVCGCGWTDDTCSETCEPRSVAHAPGCVPVPNYAQLTEIEPGEELEKVASGFGRCGAGQLLSPSGICADLDECAFGLDDCAVTPPACVNELSGQFGWQCRCPSGFRGDGVGPDGCR